MSSTTTTFSTALAGPLTGGRVRPALYCRNGRGTAAHLAVAILLGVCVPALAAVQALPNPQEPPIDRSSLDAGSPRLPGPDNPAREKLVQTLRDVAQGDARLVRKPRPPSARPGSDIAPADAAWLLGLLALHGLAMPADAQQAQHWFERAQMLGHPMAAAGVAWCQLAGCTGAPNPSAAMHWIVRVRRTDPALAKLLEWHAVKALAPLTEASNPSPAWPTATEPPMAAPSVARLHRLLSEASSAGNAQAGNELGLEYLAEGRLDQALAQFQAASARSEAAAANAALLASRLKASPANHAKPPRYSAADWYAEARRYHTGDGVPANYAEAVRLYQIAASAGDPNARRMLSLIFSRPAPDGTLDVAWMQQLAAIDIGPSGLPQGSGLVTPHGWQRDPSPLYGLVPAEWRSAAVRASPRR